jgi:hypothetical protein
VVYVLSRFQRTNMGLIDCAVDIYSLTLTVFGGREGSVTVTVSWSPHHLLLPVLKLSTGGAWAFDDFSFSTNESRVRYRVQAFKPV